MHINDARIERLLCISRHLSNRMLIAPKVVTRLSNAFLLKIRAT